MNPPRQPPHLIGLGPDSTPPDGNLGSPEQRIEGGVVELHGKVDALMVDARATDAVIRRLDATIRRMLDGYQEVLGIVSTLRARSETTDEQIGAIMGTLAKVERLVREAHAVATKAERASSTNEVALDAMDALVAAKRESTRAKADRRELVIGAARTIAKHPTFHLLIGLVLAAAVAALKGWL